MLSLELCCVIQSVTGVSRVRNRINKHVAGRISRKGSSFLHSADILYNDTVDLALLKVSKS